MKVKAWFPAGVDRDLAGEGAAASPGGTTGFGSSTCPELRSIWSASWNVDPSGLSFTRKSSSPSRPKSARAEKPVLKAKAASFAGAALFTVASIPAPALFSSTAGVWTESPLKPSAVALPSPSSSAVRFVCGMSTCATSLAK